VLIGVLCVYGVSAAFLGTAPAASVGDASGARGGTPVAIFSMSSDVGAILGPLVAGFLADSVGYPVAFAVGAALLLVGTAASVRMPREAAHPTRARVPADPEGSGEPTRVD
jgi:MFS family permease